MRRKINALGAIMGIFSGGTIAEEKCAMTSHRYGDITGRYVIYRGDSAEVDGVHYLNVEEYLKSL